MDGNLRQPGGSRYFLSVTGNGKQEAQQCIDVRFCINTAATNDTFGRYGGEEFLAVLDQTTLDGACIVGERICALARQLHFDEFDAAWRITVSVGIAQYRPQEEWRGLIERADQALYRAKAGGRDRIVRESPGTQ